MPETQAAEVLQDVAEKVNAEESTTAGPKAGEVDPQATQTETDGEVKKKGGWLRKLDKAERERDFWRDEALRNRPKEPVQPKQAETVEDKPPVRPIRPKESDFADYEKFAAARDKYEDDLLEYTDKITDYKLREAEKGRETKAKEQEIANGWATKVAEAEQKYPDFIEVAFSKDTPMNDAMMHAIVRSKVGTEIAYYLGQHQDEAERIFNLEPVDAIMEIGEIGKELKSRLTGTQSAADKEEDKPEPPAAATSRAPRPPDTVRKARSTDSTELRDDLPYKEWERRRNAQLAQR